MTRDLDNVPRPIALAAGAVVCLAAAVGLQVARDRLLRPVRIARPSGSSTSDPARRSSASTLDFDALCGGRLLDSRRSALSAAIAGRTERSQIRAAASRCSITRPRSIRISSIAYRFGAIFLSEQLPGWPWPSRSGDRAPQERGRRPAREVAVPARHRLRVLLAPPRLRGRRAVVPAGGRPAELAQLAETARGRNPQRRQRSRVGQVPVEPDSAVRRGMAEEDRRAQPQATRCARCHRPAPGDRQAVPAAAGRASIRGRPWCGAASFAAFLSIRSAHHSRLIRSRERCRSPSGQHSIRCPTAISPTPS